MGRRPRKSRKQSKQMINCYPLLFGEVHSIKGIFAARKKSHSLHVSNILHYGMVYPSQQVYKNSDKTHKHLNQKKFTKPLNPIYKNK
jgi:hypothetical protein